MTIPAASPSLRELRDRLVKRMTAGLYTSCRVNGISCGDDPDPCWFCEAKQITDALSDVLALLPPTGERGWLLEQVRELERFYVTDRVAHVHARQIERIFDDVLHRHAEGETQR